MEAEKKIDLYSLGLNSSVFKNINLKNKILLIFVRHRGCTFCRESLTRLSKNYDSIKKHGLTPVVIHMGPPESSELMQKEFGLEDVHFISDPDKDLYRLFGARRATLNEAIGPKVISRGVLSGALFKHGVGKIEGDGFQLGGVYFYQNGEVSCLHRPTNASDVEDWESILSQLN